MDLGQQALRLQIRYLIFCQKQEEFFKRDELFNQKGRIRPGVSAPKLAGIDRQLARLARVGARQVLRVRGMGYASGPGSGDLYIRTHLSLPEHLSAEQHDLVKNLAKSLGMKY